MVKLAKELGPKGVVFFGITTKQKEDPNWEKTRAVLKEHNVPYPTLVDADGTVSKAYGVRGIPHTVIIDRDGIVRGEMIGARGEAALRAKLKKAGL